MSRKLVEDKPAHAFSSSATGKGKYFSLHLAKEGCDFTFVAIGFIIQIGMIQLADNMLVNDIFDVGKIHNHFFAGSLLM